MSTIDDGSLQAAADSAEGVTAVRAVAASTPGIPPAGVDALAAAMLSAPARAALPPPDALEAALPGLLYTEAARVAFFDEHLLDAVGSGVDQVVILAAGFDTRAYRFADELRDAVVYELDRAATSAVKSQRVAERLEPAGDVRSVVADLVTDDAGAALVAAGLRTDRPVAVLCCGISMYLPADTLDGVLAWVAGLAPGSSIAIDYVYRRLVEGDDGFRGAAQVRARLAAAGEYQVLGFDPGELATAAGRHGLTVATDLEPRAITARHLTDNAGRVVGEPLGYHCLAVLRRD